LICQPDISSKPAWDQYTISTDNQELSAVFIYKGEQNKLIIKQDEKPWPMGWVTIPAQFFA